MCVYFTSMSVCVSVGEQHRVAFGCLFFSTFCSVLQILANGLSVSLKTTLLKNPSSSVLKSKRFDERGKNNNNNYHFYFSIVIVIVLSLSPEVCMRLSQSLSGCVYAFKSSSLESGSTVYECLVMELRGSCTVYRHGRMGEHNPHRTLK